MAKEKKEKKISKISIIRGLLGKGVTDINELVSESGAALGTVRVQMSKYNKENGIKRERKNKKDED